MQSGLRLDGQRVLVTGGASGIGRGIAEAFGHCGARVALSYLTSEEGAAATVGVIKAGGGEALVLAADLTHEVEVERVVAEAVGRFGGMDVLVANTGGLLQRTRVADCSRALWDAALAVNLTSIFLRCRAVIPHMERAGRGCIITVSSRSPASW
jgi:3-oxoacyl-[acyl-carrier protein] reductase